MKIEAFWLLRHVETGDFIYNLNYGEDFKLTDDSGFAVMTKEDVENR